ncbi:hypothetical protein STEG23_001111 [Scotinomys teguina]
MCRLSWFLDPGGWGKTAAVGLYFIFPGICTLSLILSYHTSRSLPYYSYPKIEVEVLNLIKMGEWTSDFSGIVLIFSSFNLMLAVG